MHRDLYALYVSCFPDYPVTETLFCELLQPEKSHIIARYDGETLIGFSMIHANSISLLCVDERYRGKGIGSELLAASERHIMDTGAGRVILGRGRCYLLQGVPASDENIRFFSNRGYEASWTSVNMGLDLTGFSLDFLPVPQSPDNVVYRFAEQGELAMLYDAVDDVKERWRAVYETGADPIFIAVQNGKIVGFEVLAPTGGRFGGTDAKVGCVGCVGVVHEARRQGIGLRMVANGIAWLKSQGCTSVELCYVELVDWYRRIGFEVTGKQWMGEKDLTSR